MSTPIKKSVVPVEIIQSKIYLIRGHKVMLDRDIAALYGVKPIALRQQVKRNADRFPDDFMFQLSGNEVEALLSQNVIPSKQVLGGTMPYAFTEQGVAMLSSVLRSKRAAYVNIQIMRVFVRLKELVMSHKDLARKIEDLERKFGDHDAKIIHLFNEIRRLLAMPEAQDGYKRTKIGFIVERCAQ